jgi:hypothetical protein
MKLLTIELPDDVYDHLQLRAAIDDKRIDEAVAEFLTDVTTAHRDGSEVVIPVDTQFRSRVRLT